MKRKDVKSKIVLLSNYVKRLLQNSVNVSAGEMLNYFMGIEHKPVLSKM